MATEIVIPVYNQLNILRGPSYGALQSYTFSPNNDDSVWIMNSAQINGYLMIFHHNYVDYKLFIYRSLDNFRTYQTIDTGLSIYGGFDVFTKDGQLYIFGSQIAHQTAQYAATLWVSSDDGETFGVVFTDTASNYSTNYIEECEISFNNGYYYICDRDSSNNLSYRYSTNGTSFTKVNSAYLNGSYWNNFQAYNMSYIGIRYVCLFPYDNCIMYGKDITEDVVYGDLPTDASWQSYNIYPYTPMSMVKVGDALYVSAHENVAYQTWEFKSIYKSLDGVSWTRHALTNNNDVAIIRYDSVNQLFVGLDKLARVSTSPDGVNWTDVSTNTYLDYWGDPLALYYIAPSIEELKLTKIFQSDYAVAPSDRWSNYVRTAEVNR